MSREAYVRDDTLLTATSDSPESLVPAAALAFRPRAEVERHVSAGADTRRSHALDHPSAPPLFTSLHCSRLALPLAHPPLLPPAAHTFHPPSHSCAKGKAVAKGRGGGASASRESDSTRTKPPPAGTLVTIEADVAVPSRRRLYYLPPGAAGAAGLDLGD